MVFLAEFFFCLNWAPVAAILLVSCVYVCVLQTVTVVWFPVHSGANTESYSGGHTNPYAAFVGRRFQPPIGGSGELGGVYIMYFMLHFTPSPPTPVCVCVCVCMYVQLSDTVYKFLGRYQNSGGSCDVGSGVSLEFALFTTVFACSLGVAAFLALTLTVEQDRAVSKPLHTPQ